MYVVIFHKDEYFSDTLCFGNFDTKEKAEYWLQIKQPLTSRKGEVVKLEETR